jgi:hypothetical protein
VEGRSRWGRRNGQGRSGLARTLGAVSLGGVLPVPGAVKADVNVRAVEGASPETVQVPLRVKPPGGDTWPEGIETEAGRAAVAPEGRWWIEMAPQVARSVERDRSRDRADLLGAPWRSRCRRRPGARGGPARGGGERGNDSPAREEPPRQGRNARRRNWGSNPAGRVEWDQRFTGRGDAPIGCEAGPAAAVESKGRRRGFAPPAMGVGGQAGEPV